MPVMKYQDALSPTSFMDPSAIQSLRIKLALGMAASMIAAGAIVAVLSGYAAGEEIGARLWHWVVWPLTAGAAVAGAAAWWLAGLLTEPLRSLKEQVRASEEKFSKAFRSNPDFIMISCLSDGRIAEVNEGFEHLTGYSAAQVVGRRTTELPLWADPSDRQRLVQRLERDGEVRNFEARFVTAAGAVRDVLISVTVMDLAGEAHIIGTARDITELKRTEEDVRRLNAELERRVHSRTAELEQANRELEQANHELESFSYSVSHDLRAPLRAIAGYANILCREYAAQLPEEARNMLVRIDRNAIRMGELIDDLLNFARVGRAALRKMPVDMRALAREVADELLALEPQRVVSMHIGALPAVCGDPSLLRQVWTNLLANALKFTRHRAHTVVTVDGHVEGNEALYSVRDNGTGFDPRYADKLFHVFQRLHRDPSFEGTGVGLAIVDRVLQRHGGRIWAEGAPDQGAAFHFTLPAA
jgi:PAS domain S-box-containing protein